MNMSLHDHFFFSKTFSLERGMNSVHVTFLKRNALHYLNLVTL